MKLNLMIVCMSLLISVAFSAKQSKKKRPVRAKKLKSGLLGSTTASIIDHPYAAGLIVRYENFPFLFCGATIIAPNFALAAAHCLSSRNILHALSMGKVVVRAGTSNIRGLTGIDHRIKGYSVHNDYKEPNQNNLAIIQVKDLFNFTFEAPITPAPADYPYKSDSEAIALDWQNTHSHGAETKRIFAKAATLLDECQTNWWTKNNTGIICTNVRAGVSDGGGGLIQDNILIGILSSHNSFVALDTIEVYTRVGVYAQWITANMGKVQVLVDQ